MLTHPVEVHVAFSPADRVGPVTPAAPSTVYEPCVLNVTSQLPLLSPVLLSLQNNSSVPAHGAVNEPDEPKWKQNSSHGMPLLELLDELDDDELPCVSSHAAQSANVASTVGSSGANPATVPTRS